MILVLVLELVAEKNLSAVCVCDGGGWDVAVHRWYWREGGGYAG